MKHPRRRRHGFVDTVRVRQIAGRHDVAMVTIGTTNMLCTLGPAGMTVRKREGDGATPIGRYRMLYGFYRGDRGPRPRSELPLRRLQTNAGWCDDPTGACYNRAVSLPFATSHERMWRDDNLYDVVIVLDHNTRPRVRGHGSAIFFHIMHPCRGPTAGCVAVAPGAMRRLLPRLSARTVVVIGRG